MTALAFSVPPASDMSRYDRVCVVHTQPTVVVVEHVVVVVVEHVVTVVVENVVVVVI
jgi:hypothetical protein